MTFLLWAGSYLLMSALLFPFLFWFARMEVKEKHTSVESAANFVSFGVVFWPVMLVALPVAGMFGLTSWLFMKLITWVERKLQS